MIIHVDKLSRCVVFLKSINTCLNLRRVLSYKSTLVNCFLLIFLVYFGIGLGKGVDREFRVTYIVISLSCSLLLEYYNFRCTIALLTY